VAKQEGYADPVEFSNPESSLFSSVIDKPG
jgi:hypothetical protein